MAGTLNNRLLQNFMPTFRLRGQLRKLGQEIMHITITTEHTMYINS